MSKNDHILLENQHFVAILSIYFRCPWFSIRFISIIWLCEISFWYLFCGHHSIIKNWVSFHSYFFQIIILLSSSESPISPNTNFDFFSKKKGVCLFILMYYMFQQLKTEKILSKVLESFLIRIKLLLNELSEINLEKMCP